jgi:hypothetical protein
MEKCAQPLAAGGRSMTGKVLLQALEFASRACAVKIVTGPTRQKLRHWSLNHDHSLFVRVVILPSQPNALLFIRFFLPFSLLIYFIKLLLHAQPNIR